MIGQLALVLSNDLRFPILNLPVIRFNPLRPQKGVIKSKPHDKGFVDFIHFSTVKLFLQGNQKTWSDLYSICQDRQRSAYLLTFNDYKDRLDLTIDRLLNIINSSSNYYHLCKLLSQEPSSSQYLIKQGGVEKFVRKVIKKSARKNLCGVVFNKAAKKTNYMTLMHPIYGISYDNQYQTPIKRQIQWASPLFEVEDYLEEKKHFNDHLFDKENWNQGFSQKEYEAKIKQLRQRMKDLKQYFPRHYDKFPFADVVQPDRLLDRYQQVARQHMGVQVRLPAL